MTQTEGSIRHDEHAQWGAFVLAHVDERLGRMTYTIINPSLINIDHTEVNPTLEGHGIGRRLLDATVEWARETGTRVKAACPFARGQFARDASIRDVLV